MIYYQFIRQINNTNFLLHFKDFTNINIMNVNDINGKYVPLSL